MVGFRGGTVKDGGTLKSGPRKGSLPGDLWQVITDDQVQSYPAPSASFLPRHMLQLLFTMPSSAKMRPYKCYTLSFPKLVVVVVGYVNKHSLLLKLASLGIFWYNAKTHTCCNLVFLFLYHQLFFTSVKFVYIWIYENQYLFIFSVLSCLKAKTLSLGWVSKHCGIVHTGEQWKQ